MLTWVEITNVLTMKGCYKAIIVSIALFTAQLAYILQSSKSNLKPLERGTNIYGLRRQSYHDNDNYVIIAFGDKNLNSCFNACFFLIVTLQETITFAVAPCFETLSQQSSRWSRRRRRCWSRERGRRVLQEMRWSPQGPSWCSSRILKRSRFKPMKRRVIYPWQFPCQKRC